MPGCNLAGPPRPVPLLVQSRVLFGGFYNQFGWFFFGFGMIFFWLAAVNADVKSFFFRGKLEKTQGVVTGVETTSFTQRATRHSKGSRIYAYHYTFTTKGGTSFQGVSYSTSSRLKKGDAVTIEFPEGNPSVSRILGMRSGVFDASAALVIIFPLMGLAFLLAGIRGGVKANHLLRHGKTAMGKLKSKTETPVRINKQPVYKLTFAFVAEDGHTYEATAKSHKPELLEDEAQEPLLYDPGDPGYAVLLDSLPGTPRIDDFGHIRVSSPAAGLSVLVLPAVTIIGHGMYVFQRFCG